MTDTFKRTREHDWRIYNPDVRGIGHTKRRNAYRKIQNRRARRVLKQNLRNELTQNP